MHEAARHAHDSFTTHVLSERSLTCTQHDKQNGRPQFVYFAQANEPLQVFLFAVDIRKHKTGVLRMPRIEVSMRDEMEYRELRQIGLKKAVASRIVLTNYQGFIAGDLTETI